MFPNITREVVGGAIVIGIVGGILLDVYIQNIIEEALASTDTEEVLVEEEPKEVRIEVVYDWTPERIEQEIREVFSFDPDTAIAVVMAEGGLNVEVQSHYMQGDIREPSFCAWQIHEPSWMKTAEQLGYGDYKTNPESCVRLAKYIYDNATDRHGNRLYWRSWSAYKNGSYQKYL